MLCRLFGHRMSEWSPSFPYTRQSVRFCIRRLCTHLETIDTV